MIFRCSYCGRVLPPEAIRWPSGACYCRQKNHERRVAPTPVGCFWCAPENGSFEIRPPVRGY
jgi:hypothetical protein